jgi:hypothetical protein
MTVYESKIISRVSQGEQRDLKMRRTLDELLGEWRKTPEASLGAVIVSILGRRPPEEIEQAIGSLKEAQRKVRENIPALVP